ncbi:MAG: hypothetical protein KDC48_11695 [Planctomycetes bacterium]|nr:hypothetical protein [Planctomycetota bacterium]
MSPAPRCSWWLCLPALLALVWFWPTLWHGWRSDDFLTVYYLDRDAGAVRWGRVFEEWVRPWFGVRDLYRPFVSLSFGGNWALGTSPLGFHLFNVLLLAGTATAVAATAARLAKARPMLVGLVAGAVVVLHPAAVEPTAWIAARTTGLQVFWSAVAMWTFVRWRDGEGRVVWPLLATALACASKEGAVLLPVTFVALSLLRGERPRLRVHAPFWLLVGGYLVFRKLLLGWFTTAEEGHTLGERFTGAVALLGQLLAPPLGGGVSLGGWLFAVMFVLLWQAMAAAGTRRALWCAPWALLLLLPGTTHVEWKDGLLLGRFVFDAVPALALFVALAVDVVPVGWLSRARLAVGLLAIAVGLAIGSRLWIDRYSDEDRLVSKVQHELLAVAKDAGPGKPFGVAALPGQPMLQPGLWGFLTQRPFAPVDLPVSGLAAMLEKDPGAPGLFGNSTPIHALVQQGAGFASWDAKGARFASLVGAADKVVEFVRDPADARRFVPKGRLSPLSAGVLEVVTRAAHVEMTPLGQLPMFEGPPSGQALDPPLPEGTHAYWFDTTSIASWYVVASLGGGVAGVSLSQQDGPLPDGTIVRAHAALGTLEGSAPATPSRVEQFVADLRAPHDDCVLYVLAPSGVYVEPVRGGELSPEARRRLSGPLRFCADVLGTCAVHWFWQGGDQTGRPARTAFGTCEVH